MLITKISYECSWGLTGFYPSMVVIPLLYNSGDQNVSINDCYVCLQVLSKQLAVWNVYLSLLGYSLVIAPVLPLIRPCTTIEMYI